MKELNDLIKQAKTLGLKLWNAHLEKEDVLSGREKSKEVEPKCCSHEKPLKSHSFTFNKEDNGGESFTIHTDFSTNGDPHDNIHISQFLTLQSYGNSATISIYDCLTPELLRKMADEIEAIEKELGAKP